MDSLQWVDHTYVQKHKSEDPHNLRAMYAENLKQYPTQAPRGQNEKKNSIMDTVKLLAVKQGRKAGISLAVLALSYVPYVGKFVLPAASFYTFNKAVGPQPAVAIFAGSLLLPRRYLVSFLQAYFSSRTLMRELVRRLLRTIIDGTNLLCSLSLTSRAFATTRNRRSCGSRIVPVSFLASDLVSTSLLRSPLLEF
jgi:hypothetical protein